MPNETCIHTLAMDICKDEPNIEAAVRKLRRKLAPMKEAIMEDMYLAATLHAVHQARGALMVKAKRNVEQSASRTVQAAADGSAAFDRGFLRSWQTPDGRWLADVTGDDLTVFAATENGKAEGHAKVARFYAALAGKVGNRTVGEVLTDEQAQAVWLERTEVKPKGRKATVQAGTVVHA